MELYLNLHSFLQFLLEHKKEMLILSFEQRLEISKNLISFSHMLRKLLTGLTQKDAAKIEDAILEYNNKIKDDLAKSLYSFVKPVFADKICDFFAVKIDLLNEYEALDEKGQEQLVQNFRELVDSELQSIIMALVVIN